MNSPVLTAPRFEVINFLDQRVDNPTFTMIEIGHGRCPIVDMQPHSFTGQQSYIGIEAGMRQQGNEYYAKRAKGAFTEKNAFFMQHYIDPGEISCGDILSNGQTYCGEYNAETILPEGIADEVVASNVFCDPIIADSWLRTARLLEEVSRLLAPTGIAVLRETITPESVDAIGDISLGRAGLHELAKVTPQMADKWEALEAIYGAERHFHRSESYYLFLGKAASPVLTI